MDTVTKHRFTVDNVYPVVDHGILPPEQRVELINGEIIDRSFINPPRGSSVTKLDRFFSRHLSQKKYILRAQNPVLLSDHSLPEADIVIAHYREALLEDEHPQAQDIAIPIEVADTTYRPDRDTKGSLCAAEGIPVYWVVDLNEQQVEVYSSPKGDRHTQTHVYQSASDVMGATATPQDIFPKN